jgi:hypothetical protein
MFRLADQFIIPSNEDYKNTFKNFNDLMISNVYRFLKMKVLYFHIHIDRHVINILQMISLVDYSNVFIQSHYVTNVHLNMIFFFEFRNHFHLLKN